MKVDMPLSKKKKKWKKLKQKGKKSDTEGRRLNSKKILREKKKKVCEISVVYLVITCAEKLLVLLEVSSWCNGCRIKVSEFELQ